jgi:GNAT superfamily N-acetyltransferase
LLRATYGEQSRFTEKYLQWQYAENPEGQAIGFDAFAGDEIAAHYVALPMRAELFGRPVRGLLALNTATHPAHQGKGLFTRVAAATFARGSELGYDFAVGVSNANATPGLVKKQHFQLVSPLDVRVGIGRPLYDERQDVDFRCTWSEEALRWRLRNPFAPYALRNGALWADAHLPGVNMYLGTAPPQAAISGEGPPSRPLTGWIGIAPNARWRGIALPVPMRFRPSPLNMVFRDLTNAGRTLDPRRVFFQALDFDAY